MCFYVEHWTEEPFTDANGSDINPLKKNNDENYMDGSLKDGKMEF